MASSTRHPPPSHRHKTAHALQQAMPGKKKRGAKTKVKAKAASAAQNPGDVLSFLQPRETLRLIKARGGKRLVKLLRVALPLSAVAVLAAIILWPIITAHGGGSLSLAAKMIPIPDLAVDRLRFSGTDSRNQPYSVTAERATRPGDLHEVYDLEKPEGDITLQDGAWIAGKALQGRFDRAGQKLWLGGNVQLFHDQGFQFTTSEANIDMQDSSAWGEAPIVMQGSFGTIRGKGFTLLDSGNVVVVKGPARAVLNLQPEAVSGKQDKKK